MTLDNDLLLIRIKQCLTDIKFQPLGEAVLVAGGSNSERSVHLLFDRLSA